MGRAILIYDWVFDKGKNEGVLDFVFPLFYFAVQISVSMGVISLRLNQTCIALSVLSFIWYDSIDCIRFRSPWFVNVGHDHVGGIQQFY